MHLLLHSHNDTMVHNKQQGWIFTGGVRSFIFPYLQLLSDVLSSHLHYYYPTFFVHMTIQQQNSQWHNRQQQDRQLREPFYWRSYVSIFLCHNLDFVICSIISLLVISHHLLMHTNDGYWKICGSTSLHHHHLQIECWDNWMNTFSSFEKTHDLKLINPLLTQWFDG